MQAIIQKLLDNPKILQISIIHGDHPPYACVAYEDKHKVICDILVDCEDLPLLLNSFSISSIAGLSYVRLKVDGKYVYLHSAIAEPDKCDVAHHCRFTLDNRRESLQNVPRSEHSRFHINQRRKGKQK